MVSLNIFLIVSLAVALTLIVVKVLYIEKISLRSSKFPEIIWAYSYNVIYIYILIFLLSFNTRISFIISAVVFILMTYFHDDLWASMLASRILDMHKSIREKIIDRLVADDYIVTHWTIHVYIWGLIQSGWLSFKNMVRLSIIDIKILFDVYKYSYKDDQELWELYEMHCRMFKHTKLDFESFANPHKTDKEKMEAYERLKKNRDPRVKFNMVSRLPWKFKHKEGNDFFFKIFYKHMGVFYTFFKTTILAILLTFVYFVYSVFFFKIQFLKQLSVWFVIGMLYFWLMSGFNFFVKRYQYGKFTSQIQRFWKRTNTCFWLIEGFLILLFFYYFLNSSQEPLYMYDYSALNQEYLVSLQVIGLNVILLSLVIYFMYFTMLRINSNSWTQINLYLIVISTFIFFSFFVETYQFYYVISTFNEKLWVLNEEDNTWVVETDSPIMRTKHQYLFVCLIAKYWHFLFIFLSWIFFLIKSFEKRKVTYVLFGANLQNMVLLYVLNFACYMQWFKWVYRRFFDLPYTWFFANIDSKFFYRFFFEIKLLVLNLFSANTAFSTFSNVVYKSVLLWGVDSLCIWKFV